jgi:hypothetical protein
VCGERRLIRYNKKELISQEMCGELNTNFSEWVLALLATYFLLGLNYPRAYAQLLGFIQAFCLNISFPHATQNSFKILNQFSYA